MIPRATYRLQFHKAFTFADAERLVPYFSRLGVSHVYASPITTARPGSMHGYDVIDPSRINPELGGEDALRRFVAALRQHDLGLIVDIVPNHMAVGAENTWWFDVLRQGRASTYAPWFDIDWDAEDESLRGKVLLPVLGKALADVLRDGEIKIDSDGGERVATYFQHRFPISGESEGDIADVLARQHYRLAWWRVANDEINWRRFFDINELVGLRMENADAFEAAHALIFRLYREGMIDGVRVDHVDGLAEPGIYCRMLRSRLESLTAQRPLGVPRDAPYIVVEKILLRDEQLPTSWQTNGTSGYDFMNEVSAVQHAAAGEETLTALWEAVSGRDGEFEVEEQAARREMIARSFTAQLEACAMIFHRLACEEGTEIPRAALRRALIELLAHFPVYRTYAASGEGDERGVRFLDAAVRGARETCLSTERDVVNRLRNWLAHPRDTAEWRRAVTRFEQLSAPVAAKSVEDTTFYRYGRLLSRNDVGFDASRFADSAADFHAHMRRRDARFPHAMLATATHDHKRGEDVRARLAVFSDCADEWSEASSRWIGQIGLSGLSGGDTAMLLQTIVGAWPLDLAIEDDAGRAAFAERLAQWQQKALREEKLETDWSVPNETYEVAARELLGGLLVRNAHPDTLTQIVAFVERIAPAGAVNGLAQTLLKLTVPGVPDIYQGTERWDFSLVDPDNRRPVDYATRDHAQPGDIKTLMKNWRDGSIKQAMITSVLALRRRGPDLFASGDYVPLAVEGGHADRLIAFARRLDHQMIAVTVPRAPSALLRPGDIAFETAQLVNTHVALQHEKPLVDLFNPASARLDRMASAANLFSELPFAVLVSPGLI